MDKEKEYSYETEYLIGMSIEDEPLIDTLKGLAHGFIIMFLVGTCAIMVSTCG